MLRQKCHKKLRTLCGGAKSLLALWGIIHLFGGNTLRHELLFIRVKGIAMLVKIFTNESGNLISKTSGTSTTEIVTRTPKSTTAQRTIPLFPEVWADLMSYYYKQQRMIRVQGITLSATTPIFSTPAGLTYKPRTYEDLFKRTLKTAGLHDINFHALRRTFATRALEAGMDIKVLSSILGHAQASTTLNLYAHALPDHKRQSMEKMSSFYRN